MVVYCLNTLKGNEFLLPSMTCCWCWLINNDSAIFLFVIWLSGYIMQEFLKSIECPRLWCVTTALAIVRLAWFLQFDSCCFILILIDFPVSPMYERSQSMQGSLYTPTDVSCTKFLILAEKYESNLRPVLKYGTTFTAPLYLLIIFASLCANFTDLSLKYLMPTYTIFGDTIGTFGLSGFSMNSLFNKFIG